MKKLPYDMMEYQADALTTESPVDAEKQYQLVRHWSLVKEALETAREEGEMLDRVKKIVYYGKVDAELTEQLPMLYPVGDERERIEEMTRIAHGVMGLITEVGETSECLLKVVQGEMVDRINLIEEMGDLLWYINLILAAVGSNIPACALLNRNKLEKRFPDKFEMQRALERNLAAERRVLEEHAPVPAISAAPAEEE